MTNPEHLSPRVTMARTDPSGINLSLDSVLTAGSLKAATEEMERAILKSSMDRFLPLAQAHVLPRIRRYYECRPL